MRSILLGLLVASLLTSLSAQKHTAKQNPDSSQKQTFQQKQPDTPGATDDSQKDKEEGEDKGPWKNLQYRLVGPFRGGRVVAVSGVVGQENVYYFGSTAGGVWKTTDGGLNWKPIFDKTKDASPAIGAIAVSESDPNVIYLGTGEACIRGNIVGGNGLYKSIDAGKTWKFVGLADTHAIGRLAVNPKNPDIALVAALGHPFGDNEERGIFRTQDGGKTWQKVLYKDARSGGIDVVFDPTNANILFAALWQARRTPWSLDSGGPGSGLYRSIDGGTTWKELKAHGLPEGILGRIGVTVSGANPNRVWAVIEAEKGGIYRSDDGGDSWHLMTDDHRFRQRAWYYSHIFADPKSADTVYILNTGAYRSNDGGKTFSRIRAPHGDNHALWIDPTNPKRLMNGNDGGATISTDGGDSWTSVYNQPTAQFYHVTTDNRFPYYIYGAQQDNSTVGIASASPEGAIDRPDWYAVGGGESGYIAPDPTDPEVVYAGSYGGEITRHDHRTGEEQAINPWPVNPIGWAAGDVKHRFQWTEPIIFSPHDPKTMYFAGEVLFKTIDGGMSWTIISPDLTRNDKSKQVSSGGPITKDNTGVEVYGTIFSVVESPVQKDLIWAGTDDGLVQLTRDGGQHWENITPKAMPEWGTVSMIEVSSRDAGTAYLAVERHKSDDFAPYVFKTTDFGKTWTKLVTGIPANDYVHAVRIDARHPNLLFAGTEQGVYISYDDGAHWQPLQLNLPPAPVNDLVIKNNDLVVATHGRSFWVLDDITPLEQYEDSIPQQEAHLFTPAAANHTVFRGSFFAPSGNVGKNPPAGAIIDYWLKTSLKKPDDAKPAAAAPGSPTKNDASPAASSEANKKEDADGAPKITVEILDSSGKVIRKYPKKEEPGADDEEDFFSRDHNAGALPADAGFNRFVWDLRYEGATKIPHAPLWGGNTDGPEALPGAYQVKLTVLGKSYTAPLEIKADPRLKITQEDVSKQFDLLLKIRDKVTETDDTVIQIRDLRDQIKAIDTRLKNDPRSKVIADAGKSLDKKMNEVEESLIQTKAKSGQDVLNFPVRLNNHLVALGGVVASADSAPTKQSYEVFDMLSKDLDEQMTKWKTIVSADLAAYNDLVKTQEVPAVILKQPEAGK
ncbi:MAG TPA: hypothetical protein VFF64_26085 [Candidatus Eremiobacteraceae bacterium]|nr:hypothetical protein [Candidatus Eremiobacteraceae bacterium]